MTEFPQLIAAVQRNCDISDARYAGEYGLCTFLLKMREYYRWEHELSFSQDLPRERIGDWLTQRETEWQQLEEQAFLRLPLVAGGQEPFDAVAVNSCLLPQGYVYSAGYGRFHKPVFFLGKLARVERYEGLKVIVSSCEYARELSAPPAMLQGSTIFVREESVRRYVWEKIEEWRWRSKGGAMARALDRLDFAANPEAALARLTAAAMRAMTLHEVGEARAGVLLGDGWPVMLLEAARSRAEPVMRAVRDLLADCLETLPGLLANGDATALHFYFASYDAPRRQLFPRLQAAYEAYASSGESAALIEAVAAGAEYWLAAGRQLLAAEPAARAEAVAEVMAGSL